MCGGGGIGKALGGIGKAISGVVSGIGKAISSVVKSPIFAMLAPIALNFFVPGLGLAMTGALGMSASFAPALMGAVSGGVSGLLGGQSFSGVLKSAALGGLAAGVADFAITGNNPLSGVFSGAEGGAAANPLTAGGVGSTNLTGAGSGLGVDKSTLATQFGAPSTASTLGSLNPSASSTFGQLTPSASGGFNQIVDPVSGLNAQGLRAAANSGSTGIWDSVKGVASKLIPESTLGKVALGTAGLGLLSGIGGGKAPEQGQAPPGDPSFNQRLEQKQFRYNPLVLNSNNANLNAYGQAAGSADASSFNPITGQFDRRAGADSGGEYRWINPAYYSQDEVTPSVPRAQGGMIPQYVPQYNTGGYLSYLASGGRASEGMTDMGTASGMLHDGQGDGVSDSIEATIGDKQPARLAGGEFVIPSRIVAEIGNGSSEAGASRLEEMLQRVAKRLRGNRDIAADSKSYQLLPA